MLKILILLIAVILIAATGWWFFGHHQEKAMPARLNDNDQDQKNPDRGQWRLLAKYNRLKKGRAGRIGFLSQGPFILSGKSSFSRTGNQ